MVGEKAWRRNVRLGSELPLFFNDIRARGWRFSDEHVGEVEPQAVADADRVRHEAPQPCTPPRSARKYYFDGFVASFH